METREFKVRADKRNLIIINKIIKNEWLDVNVAFDVEITAKGDDYGVYVCKGDAEDIETLKDIFDTVTFGIAY